MRQESVRGCPPQHACEGMPPGSRTLCNAGSGGLPFARGVHRHADDWQTDRLPQCACIQIWHWWCAIHLPISFSCPGLLILLVISAVVLQITLVNHRLTLLKNPIVSQPSDIAVEEPQSHGHWASSSHFSTHGYTISSKALV